MSFVQWVAPRRSACLAVSFAIRMIAILLLPSVALPVLAQEPEGSVTRPAAPTVPATSAMPGAVGAPDAPAAPEAAPAAAAVLPPAASPDYVIGPHDVLAISVLQQKDISGAYPVEADGTFSFPWLGRVQAAGLTIRAFEESLREKLKDGYFRDPQVSVTVQQYRSRRVDVVGEVRNPGPYVMMGPMTLLEVLAQAGSVTPNASGEVLIVKGRNGRSAGLPGEDPDAEVITVDVNALQSGALRDQVTLEDGDTVYVPRAATVYVFGEVRAPGAYPVRKGTTVLQALSLAGGATESGALNRTRVIRIVDNEQREIRVDMNEPVQPGDTIIVPVRFF